MKNTRKFLSAVMALTMVSAIAPMSAFADDTQINQDSDPKTGTMTATYDVQAKYTVTIPAGVDLKSDASVSKNITASDVMLESGKAIIIKLESANHTESGSTFHAQTEKGDSTATYTIGKGNADSGVSIGDVVAEFNTNGSQALTFSKAEGATYAGTHTETLTFGIGTTKSLKIEGYSFSVSAENRKSDSDLTISYIDGATWEQIVGMNDGLNVFDGYVCQSPINRLFNGANQVKATDVFDSNANYVFIWEN